MCLKSVSSATTMQGFHTHSHHCCREMCFILTLNIKVSGAWNVGQGHLVMKSGWRVYQGQLLCKVSSSPYFYTWCKFSRWRNILTKTVEREMKFKGAESRCLLEECVKGNYYARFHTPSYHCCRVKHLDMNCWWTDEWTNEKLNSYIAPCDKQVW